MSDTSIPTNRIRVHDLSIHNVPCWIRVLLIKSQFEKHIHAHPEIPVFECFVHCWEGLPIWQAAAAQASLATKKQIDLIFPPYVIVEPEEEKTMQGECR